MQKTGTFLWLDMEMTGLDPYVNTILEVALIVTSQDLKPLDKGLNLIIHHPKEVLEAMDEWNQSTHGSTGLVHKVLNSNCTMQEAENTMLNYVMDFFGEKSTPVCGNSVWQDRLFLVRHMPRFNGYMHYRNIDVSTLKELSYRWYPKVQPYKKSNKHSALADILESIEELKYYRKNMFQSPALVSVLE